MKIAAAIEMETPAFVDAWDGGRIMIARELKEARLRLGLTQHEMAEAMNTPFRTYQDWEGERRRVPGICSIVVRCIERSQRKRKKKL